MLYTKLKHLSSEIKELTKLGVVDPVWQRNIEIIEKYFELINQGVCKHCAYIFVAEEMGISWSSVKKIVKRLSE
jgi:hypothetical protein